MLIDLDRQKNLEVGCGHFVSDSDFEIAFDLMTTFVLAYRAALTLSRQIRYARHSLLFVNLLKRDSTVTGKRGRWVGRTSIV